MEPAYSFKEFELDPSVEIAPVIYRNQPHRTTNSGVSISARVTAELRRFVCGYSGHLGSSPDNRYFRFDIYGSGDKLVILEANAAFVDGWGTALNLTRAVSDNIHRLCFPFDFALLAGHGEYRPELELLVSELAARGQYHRLQELPYPTAEPSVGVYVYGRFSNEPTGVYPADGLARDNKLHLARFSRSWQSDSVVIPQHFTYEDTAWDDIPDNVFLKFCDKSAPECDRARFSVQPGKPRGKSPFLRRCYNEGKLLAQEYVWPERYRDQNVQMVVLTDGQELVGYAQFSGKPIINDDSVHGPLIFEG